MFKEKKYVATSVQEKLAKLEDVEVQQLYGSMYQLPPMRSAEPDENVNAPIHKEHRNWKTFALTFGLYLIF